MDTPDGYSRDIYANISWLFSLDVVQAEMANDLPWLLVETAEQLSTNDAAQVQAMSNFKSPLAARKRVLNKNSYLIVEYTDVFFKPKFCDKTSEEIFNSPVER